MPHLTPSARFLKSLPGIKKSDKVSKTMALKAKQAGYTVKLLYYAKSGCWSRLEQVKVLYSASAS